MIQITIKLKKKKDKLKQCIQYIERMPEMA